MKVRLVGVLVRNDIAYEVQAFLRGEWVTIRCFEAREIQMAIDFMSAIGKINTNKYDILMKFPNTILIGE
jgi:hypothetical protein